MSIISQKYNIVMILHIKTTFFRGPKLTFAVQSRIGDPLSHEVLGPKFVLNLCLLLELSRMDAIF